MTLGIDFGVSVTIDYALVLDSKGIRQAVVEKNPIKALNSFAFRDTFNGVDKPLVVFEASVTASVSVSAAIVKIGVSGGLSINIQFDFYDPNPATSGGLIRPFELINISPNPLKWFEVTISAYVNVAVYVKIGLFLGFFEITVFQWRKEFRITIVDSLKITPPPIGRIAKIGPTGTVAVSMSSSDITCKHMDGGSGDETVQCWESSKEYPVIGYFKQVRGLEVASQQGRRLELSHASFGKGSLTIDCLASSIDCSTQRTLLLRYIQCQIYGGELRIGGNELYASEGPVKFRSGALIRGDIYLPVPSQDFLQTTVGRECNAEWALRGDTSLTIMGSQLGPNCVVLAYGGELDSILSVNLALDAGQTCAENSVALDLANGSEPRGRLLIGGILRVQFNSTVYNDVVIEGRNDCHDEIHIKQIATTVKSVDINTFGGDDTIVIGTENQPYENLIHADIIVDGGDGLGDEIIVHDGSSETKNQVINANSILGIQFGINENRTFFYKNAEVMLLKLGNVVDVNVTSTVPGFDLTIHYNNHGSNNIYSTSTSGPLNIISDGDSNNYIKVSNGRGGVFIDLRSGDYDIDVSDSIGAVNIITDGSNNSMRNETISIINTEGNVGLNLGPALHCIDVHKTSPGIWTDVNSITHTWQGDVTVSCETGTQVIDLLNIGGNAFVETGGGGNNAVTVNRIVWGGDLNVTCLGSGNDHIEVNLAEEDRVNSAHAGYVTTYFHSVNINTGDGNDHIQIYGLGFSTIATVLGGRGNDTLLVDGRVGGVSDPLFVRNSMDGTALSWNGGADEDSVEVYFVSTGNSSVTLRGDNDGPNYVTLHCSNIACNILSRDTFLANIMCVYYEFGTCCSYLANSRLSHDFLHFSQDPLNSNSWIERVNIDKVTQSITSLVLYLNEGNNEVHFDDTIGTMVRIFVFRLFVFCVSCAYQTLSCNTPLSSRMCLEALIMVRLHINYFIWHHQLDLQLFLYFRYV